MDKPLILLIACLILLYFIKDILVALVVLCVVSFILTYAIDDQYTQSTQSVNSTNNY